MKTSEQINDIAAAFAAAQPGIKDAVANTENPFFKSTYADLLAVKGACLPSLNAQGIAVIQIPTVLEGKVGVITRLVHKSGQWIEGELLLPATKQDPQAYGSAITYARRYALASIAGVATADDDGNAATHGQTEPPQRQQRPRPAAPPPPPPQPEDTSKLTDIALANTVINFGKAIKDKLIKDCEMGMLDAAGKYAGKLSTEQAACQARIKEYVLRAVKQSEAS